MRCSRLFILAAVLTASILASCKSPGLAGPKPEEQTQQLPTDFDITVGSGLTPSISWTSPGDARGNMLYMSDATNGLYNNPPPVWILSASFSPGFASPLKVGVSPVGADCTALSACFTVPLQQGHTYYIQLNLKNGKTGQKMFKR